MKPSEKFQHILDFASFLNNFRAVERVILVHGQERYENDAEHSFMLAMLAWRIVEMENLPLNIDKVMRCALVHDLVETYAGDTFVFTKDTEYAQSKKQREADALQRIMDEFKNFPGLAEAIQAYEDKNDAESRFVYALDKVQPVIQIYLDGGRIWKRKKVTLDMLVKNKTEKIAISPEIEKYWNEFVAILKHEEGRLFS